MNILQKPIDPNIVRMNIAIEMSKLSKDPSTKVGAVLVSPDGRQIIPAYNGFPEGIPDNEEWWNNRDENGGEFTKYNLVIHAEKNCFINAKQDVTGWSLYVTGKPCLECGKEIVARKIKAVYYIDKKFNMNLQEEKVEKLFKLGKVQFIKLMIEKDFGMPPSPFITFTDSHSCRCGKIHINGAYCKVCEST